MAQRVSSPMYNSMWQVRRDAWSDLEEAATRLAERGQEAGAADQNRVRELLSALAPIEHYWGYPGWHQFEDVQRLEALGELDRFAREVSVINRSMVHETFRRSTNAILTVGLDAEVEEVDQKGHRPYFEVLVVDDITAAQERRLREQLRALRRRDDPFVYEIVVVASVADAVAAVLFNFNVQACVIHRRFGLRSAQDLSQMGVVVEEQTAEEFGDLNPAERAQLLGRRLHEIRPEIDNYLMAEVAVEDLAGRIGKDFRRDFHSREGLLELHLSILRGVAHRYRAPFFAALRDYSHQPTGAPGSCPTPTSRGYGSTPPSPPTRRSRRFARAR